VAKGRIAGETKIYTLIAVFFIIIIFLSILFTNNNLVLAYVPGYILGSEWHEDLDERIIESSPLSIEKFGRLVYKTEGKYPAYLSITTIKSLFMVGEEEIQKKIKDAIEQTSWENIVLDNSSKLLGRRILENGHESLYIIYNGTDKTNLKDEDVRIIGEIWNCGMSGTSIVCIGVAQITDNTHNNSMKFFENWTKIIKDEAGTFGTGLFTGDDGLISNIICH
jgi:hypothetical protein